MIGSQVTPNHLGCAHQPRVISKEKSLDKNSQNDLQSKIPQESRGSLSQEWEFHERDELEM